MDRRTELANSVLTGLDGWLFHRDHGAVEQLTGLRPLPAYEVRMWRYMIETRRHWIEARGGRYYLYVAPEKHVVYADKLGNGLTISDERPAMQLSRALERHNSGVELLYPLEALQRARSVRETYFVNDTHWNMFGAYIGYRELFRALSPQHAIAEVPESRLEYYERDYEGDLGVRLVCERIEPGLYYAVKEPQARVVGENHVFTRGGLHVFEQPNRDLARVVLFRDSFANWLLPVLAESVSRLVAVSSMEILPDLVEAEQPDIVITQIAERYLNFPFGPNGEGYFPDDLRAPPFEALCRMTCEQVRACRL